MLTDLCQELRNWFDRGKPKLHGTFTISGGTITDSKFTDIIKRGQYFRIIDSDLNDGVYCYDDGLMLEDEVFTGTIWLMGVPPAVVALSDEIDAWVAQYGTTVSGPFTSESFGGYSYSKESARTASGSPKALTWSTYFADKLNRWRKI